MLVCSLLNENISASTGITEMLIRHSFHYIYMKSGMEVFSFVIAVFGCLWVIIFLQCMMRAHYPDIPYIDFHININFSV